MPSYVITGAGRGLGYAFVKHLARNSQNQIFGLVRDSKSAQQRAEQDGLEKNVKFVEGEISSSISVLAAADQVSKLTGGTLDILINNAAYIHPEGEKLLVHQTDPAELEKDFEKSFLVNVIAVAHTVNAFLPLLRHGQLKKVISISTGMADCDFISRFNIAIAAPYAASKAALNALVAKYHAGLGHSEGLVFVAISPGLVSTQEKEFTKEEIQAREGMVKLFRDYAPHFEGPITPAESVDKVLAVVERATVESMGGQFVSHFGNQQWL